MSRRLRATLHSLSRCTTVAAIQRSLLRIIHSQLLRRIMPLRQRSISQRLSAEWFFEPNRFAARNLRHRLSASCNARQRRTSASHVSVARQHCSSSSIKRHPLASRISLRIAHQPRASRIARQLRAQRVGTTCNASAHRRNLQRASASRTARWRGLHRASVQLTLRISAFNIAHQRVMCRASARGAWRMARGAWRIRTFRIASQHVQQRAAVRAPV